MDRSQKNGHNHYVALQRGLNYKQALAGILQAKYRYSKLRFCFAHRHSSIAPQLLMLAAFPEVHYRPRPNQQA